MGRQVVLCCCIMNEHRKVWRIEKNSDFHLDGQAYSKLQGLFEFIEKEEPIGFLSEQKTQKEIAFQDYRCPLVLPFLQTQKDFVTWNRPVLNE